MTQTGFALASEASDRRTHFQMLVEDEEGRELLFDVPQVTVHILCTWYIKIETKSMTRVSPVDPGLYPGVFLAIYHLTVLSVWAS